ncbi:ComF family protein [Thermovenabulum sp.]|uniref:ComF family protein n=1 Tax=Thermovenabulum sp. TaxID=3100335 RepID=UPI003C7C9DDD
MVDFLKKIAESFLNALYPVKTNCTFCGKKIENGMPVCGECLSGLEMISPPFCEKCGKPLYKDLSTYCYDCRRKKHYFEKARAYGVYEGVLKGLIHEFKYNGERRLSTFFGEKLFEAYERYGFEDIEVIVPVPLHKKREEKRGFNQSLLLAKELGERTKKEVRDALIRTRNTEHQTALPREKRDENVKDAFKIKIGSPVGGKNVLLVDDVYTTGNTADECAKALLSGGAKKVYVITLARG